MTQVQHIRQQNDEFNALTNIYLEQFHVVKETAPYKFNVLCKPYIGNQFEYQLNLMFEYTKQYPFTPIKYELEPLAGLTRDNLNTINRKIDQIISNSEQKPVVYDIVEQTRTWIHQYLVEGRAYQTDQVELAAKQQVFERPKFAAFTPVTVQNFVAWKKEFEAKNKIEEQKKKKQLELKPTGKEWFLGKHEDEQESEEDEDESEQDDEEGEIAAVAQEEIKNELFQG